MYTFIQVFCGIAHVLLLLEYFAESRQVPLTRIWHGISTNPTLYFQLIAEVIKHVYKIGTILSLWFAKKRYLKIVQFLEEHQYYTCLLQKSRVWIKTYIRFYYIISWKFDTRTILSLKISSVFMVQVKKLHEITAGKWFLVPTYFDLQETQGT